MADNLTVTIGADSTKLRADLAKAQAALRDFSKELRSAAAEARKSGETEHLQAASARYEAAAASVRKYSTELRAASKAHVEGALTARETVKGIAELARESGLAIEGIRALRFGVLAFDGAQVIRGITDVVNKVMELVRASKQTGFDPSTLKAFGAAVEDAGGGATLGADALKRFGDRLTEAQKKAVEAGKAVGTGVSVVRGNVRDVTSEITNLSSTFTDTLHGAKASLKDLSDGFAILQLDPTKFSQAGEGMDKFLTEVSRRLVELHRTGRREVELNAAAVDLLGHRYAELSDVLEGVARGGGLQALKERLGITPEQVKRVEDYNRVVLQLSRTWTELTEKLAILVLPNITQGLTEDMREVEAFAKFVVKTAGEVEAAWAELGQSMTSGIATVVANINAAWAELVPSFTTIVGDIEGLWNGFIQTAYHALDAIASAVRSVKSAVGLGGGAAADGGGAAPAANGNAAGGYIRGPGTGTSDSILARISNGEFIVRAAAVRRLGLDYLHSLNNYASGGLVDRPRVTFAAGGLAAPAAAGTPVHLHLGGGTFVTTATASVASALISEAHRSAVSSAGVKPSWFGGRPSGR